MAWVESVSPSFRARHESEDSDAVAAALEALERMRDRLAPLLARTPGDVTVVFHPAPGRLDLARPQLVAARRLTAPAARRYLAGWASGGEIHTLAPRELAARATSMPGSRELLARTPPALYARLALSAANPALPPPATPGRLARARRWSWALEGCARHLAGQLPHARAVVALRLREGPRPAFPPAPPDALLLGMTLVDMVVREDGMRAAVRLATEPHPDGPGGALARAFGGRSLALTERAWRAHLERLAAVDGRRRPSAGVA
jgi:hypothetical protein